MMTKLFGILVGVLALALCHASGVHAHAFLDHADPRVGSTVRTAPTQIKIWYTENLEPAFSMIQVVNEAGQRVDKGDNQVDPSTPDMLRISVSPLSPGTYKVIWRVLSVDTHVTEGDFTFRVGP